MLDAPLVHSIDVIGTGLVVLAINDGIRYGKSNLWDYQSRAQRYAIIAYLSSLPRPILYAHRATALCAPLVHPFYLFALSVVDNMTDFGRFYDTNWTICRQHWIQFLIQIIESSPNSATLSLIPALPVAIAPPPRDLSPADPTTIVATFIDALHVKDE
ncbi:hypothetical protein JCM21900_004567 [Sporobolomyces salmonicolor]